MPNVVSLFNQPPVAGPVRPNQPQFSGAVDSAVDFLYGRGPGVRYAFEQTIGYTVPRTLQQWFRSFNITGKTDRQAAEERFLEDLGADFTDTFFPGLLATWAISPFVLDKLGKNTHTALNIDHDSLKLYEQLAKQGQTQSGFFTHLEKTLHNASPLSHKPPLALEAEITQLAHEATEAAKKGVGYKFQRAWLTVSGKATNPQEALVKILLEKLGLGSTKLSLKLANTGHTVETTLPNLIRDTVKLTQRTGVSHWGNTLATALQKTAQLQPWQGVGTGVALVASLGLPWMVRYYSRLRFKTDEFSGTRKIREHFEGPTALAASPATSSGSLQPAAGSQGVTSPKKLGKFQWFPYLRKAWSEGNPWPTLFAGGFLTTVVGLWTKHNVFIGANPLKNAFKALFTFDRGFPFTSIKQMELTYGLLCAFRLFSRRDESEFRESALRDAILGWPTLTYGNELLRSWMSGLADKHWLKPNLSKTFSALGPEFLAKVNHQNEAAVSILKLGNAAREKIDLSAPALKNLLGLTEEQALRHLPQLQQVVEKTHNRVTLISALLSWAALAFIEPQIGISVTNWWESRKHKTPTASVPSLPSMPVSQLVFKSASVPGALPQQALPSFQPVVMPSPQPLQPPTQAFRVSPAAASPFLAAAPQYPALQPQYIRPINQMV